MSNVSSNPVLAELVSKLTFVPTTKQILEYTRHEGEIGEMPLLSYAYNSSPNLKIVTYTSNGRETENTAQIGDVVISGVFGELYVLAGNDFRRLYQNFSQDGIVIPNQCVCRAAQVPVSVLAEPLTFTASWGETMVLASGDFLVVEPSGDVCRVALEEFLETYCWPY